MGFAIDPVDGDIYLRGFKGRFDQHRRRAAVSFVAEIREELKSTLPGVKQQAVLKLVYLEMMGYDVQWASFHFVDVMSFPRFRAKRIGFLAASQTFDDETDVALLTTNLFRKSFASPNPQETGLAVAALAKLATPELARDLLSEVTALLASSRPLLRKTTPSTTSPQRTSGLGQRAPLSVASSVNLTTTSRPRAPLV